jgi:hypothetical protein
VRRLLEIFSKFLDPSNSSVMSPTAYLATNAKLCDICASIFSETATWDGEGTHNHNFQSLDSLQQSSRLGCQLCCLCSTSWGAEALQRLTNLGPLHPGMASEPFQVSVQEWIVGFLPSYTLRFKDKRYPEDPGTEYGEEGIYIVGSIQCFSTEGMSRTPYRNMSTFLS